jgi:hypothetical protein
MQGAVANQIQEECTGGRETTRKDDVKENANQAREGHFRCQENVDSTQQGNGGKDGKDNKKDIVKITEDNIRNGVSPLRGLIHSSLDYEFYRIVFQTFYPE